MNIIQKVMLSNGSMKLKGCENNTRVAKKKKKTLNFQLLNHVSDF